jgi:hypothetical protein
MAAEVLKISNTTVLRAKVDVGRATSRGSPGRARRDVAAQTAAYSANQCTVHRDVAAQTA